MSLRCSNPAPSPACGSYADGFEPVARRFSSSLADGQEIGASFVVYFRGSPVVDLWGGYADAERRLRWTRDSRLVVFSATKGLAAMAFHLLADRGVFDWDAPVATYWPEFGRADKKDITVRTLLNHRGGLPYLSAPLTVEECIDPSRTAEVERALVEQRPAWTPGTSQGYHAITFGMYAAALFERLADESLGVFLRRELFEPLGSDAHLGTPAAEDGRFATLYSPPTWRRAGLMVREVVFRPESTEARVARDAVSRASIARRAFLNPAPTEGKGPAPYNSVPIRRAELAWASATASADGLARAYLPFAGGGVHDGRRYFREPTLGPLCRRQSWEARDRVLAKPLGWSQGFLKEERHLFSPNPESFGHAGLGGFLGWCDPVDQLAVGYVMNRMDWRVRSPRAVALCRALYECEPVFGRR